MPRSQRGWSALRPARYGSWSIARQCLRARDPRRPVLPFSGCRGVGIRYLTPCALRDILVTQRLRIWADKAGKALDGNGVAPQTRRRLAPPRTSRQAEAFPG